MVGAAVVLKALNQLPQALPKGVLVARLRRVFGDLYYSGSGGQCGAEELVEELLSAGDLLEDEAGLRVSPAWGCRKEKKAD